MFKRLSYLSITAILFISSVFTLLPHVANADTSSCTNSLAPSSSVANTVVTQAYNNWKTDYVTSNGAGINLRVQRSLSDNNDTVSEGIGYGMLFAAYNNDQATFNGLWNYEQAHLDPNGLMNWDIASNGSTIGFNGATDADEDMALALIMADKTWGGYNQAAINQIQLVRKYEVEAGTYALKPGDVWGGSNELDPSYLTPGYYQVFATYSGDSSWNQVAAESYSIVNSALTNTSAGSTGFLPDWSTASGYATSGMSYNYGYDAVRVGLRVGLSDSWYCNATAGQELGLLNSSYSNIGLSNIVDGYTLSGQAVGTNKDQGGFVAPAAAAAMTDTNQTYRTSAWNAELNSQVGSYYSDSLRMFGLLVTSGKFVNPLTVTQTPTATNPTNVASVTNSSIDVWWPSNGSSVSGVQPFQAMLENYSINDYTMYWQVDGGQLNLMSNNTTNYPHKQANVDVSGWNWDGSGPYKITFVAITNSGTIIDSAASNITITK